MARCEKGGARGGARIALVAGSAKRGEMRVGVVPGSAKRGGTRKELHPGSAKRGGTRKDPHAYLPEVRDGDGALDGACVANGATERAGRR